MQILLYEFLTGGGLAEEDLSALPASLLTEGTAMIRALAADMAAVGGAEATVMRDERLSDLAFPGCRVVDVVDAKSEAAALAGLSAESAWTVLIAPEFNGYLL